MLVLDVQNALIKANPYNVAGFIKNIQSLIGNARQKDIEIVYVQPDMLSLLEKLGDNMGNWEIYHKVAPNPVEKIFDKKYPSAFKETDLHNYLQDKGVASIIIVGISTELCVDTTCRVAFEYGYNVIIAIKLKNSPSKPPQNNHTNEVFFAACFLL